MMRRAFTLIEVLVVVAVIALLISVLMPTLTAARRAAKSAACLSQMRQIGLATQMYAQANLDFLPRSSHSALAVCCMPWGYALCPYLGMPPYRGPGPGWDGLFNGLYRCPQDPRRDRWSYGKSVWFELTEAETGEVLGLPTGPTFPKTTSIRFASTTIVYGELRTGSGTMADHIMAHFWYLGGKPEVDAKRHGTRCNFTFVDGHAESRVFTTTFDKAKNIDLYKPTKLAAR